MEQGELYNTLLEELKGSDLSKEQYQSLSSIIDSKLLKYRVGIGETYPFTGLYYSLDFANYVIKFALNNGIAINNRKLGIILQLILKAYYEVHRVILFSGCFEKGFRGWQVAEVYEEYSGFGCTEIFMCDEEIFTSLHAKMFHSKIDLNLINDLILIHARKLNEELYNISILPENEQFIKDLSVVESKGHQKVKGIN